MKWHISNLVSSGKTMLKVNTHNNWREHNIETTISHEMHVNMDYMGLLSNYLCRRVIVIM